MELEVNNLLNLLGMANNSGKTGNAIAGAKSATAENFSALIAGQNETLSLLSKGLEVSVRENKPNEPKENGGVDVSVQDKPVVKEKNEAKPATRETPKEADKPENKTATAKEQDELDNQVAAKPQTTADKVADNGKKAATKKIADNSGAVVNEEAPASELLDKVAEGFDAVAAGLGEYILQPLNIAQMPQVDILNVTNGEVLSVNGKELAAYLEQNPQIVAFMVQNEGKLNMVLAPADKIDLPNVEMSAQNAADMPLNLNGMELVPVQEAISFADIIARDQSQDIKAHYQNNASVVPSEVTSSAILEEQMAALSEKLGKDAKVELKVEVKEEKIAYQTSENLLANAAEVDEVIAKINADTTKTAENVVLSEAEQPLTNNNVNNQITLSISSYVEIAPAVETAGKAFSATGGVVQNVSVQAHNVGVGEFVKTTNVAAKSEDVSFKDMTKGLGKDVAEQVKVNITREAVKGVDKIEIQLKPKELGNIEIKMHIGKDGKLSAEVIAARADVAETLQKDSESLSKAFQNAGFDTDNNSLQFSHKQENESSEAKPHFKFVNDNFEEDLNGTEFASVNNNGRLNIRV